jgi:FkbM family methyltransferase
MPSLKQVAKRLIPRRLWAELHLLRQRWLLQSFPRVQVRHSFGGVPLHLELADPLARGWYDRDWPVMPEITVLREHGLRPGATVFNLGAHQCVVALVLAHCVGPTGRVVALEPTAHNVQAGHRNRLLNGAENLTIRCAAVGDRPGVIRFYPGYCGRVDDGGQRLFRSPAVPLLTIDNMTAQYGVPDVLYLDVEGYEVHALRGAEQTLCARPDCMVEVHVGQGLEHFGGSPGAVLAYFPDSHYEKLIFSEEWPTPVPFAADSPLLQDRFFLIALRRRGD